MFLGFILWDSDKQVPEMLPQSSVFGEASATIYTINMQVCVCMCVLLNILTCNSKLSCKIASGSAVKQVSIGSVNKIKTTVSFFRCRVCKKNLANYIIVIQSGKTSCGLG